MWTLIFTIFTLEPVNKLHQTEIPSLLEKCRSKKSEHYLQRKTKVCSDCLVFYWKHEDGWDVFYQSDGYKINGEWIPKWFDCQIAEDIKTKKQAVQINKKYQDHKHLLGLCLK